MSDLMTGLPGEELLRQGIIDFRSGRCTVAACLVAIAQKRLVQAGLIGPAAGIFEPELRLYRLLGEDNDGVDAYSRYNSLLLELVSFEQALDRRLSRTRSGS